MRHGERKRDRLNPRPWHADYFQLRALRVQIAGEIGRHFAGGPPIAVLDVGCSDRPYEPLFEDVAEHYVGVDIGPGPAADVVASADALPFDDQSFNCVLCTQPDPGAAVAEMWRVLRPGGLLLLSTHGVSFVDRALPDLWRWTQHGLRLLLAEFGAWTRVTVAPAGGVFCAAAYLVGGQVEAASHRAGVTWMSEAICLLLNACAWNGDRLTARLFPEIPPDASVNYLAMATRGAGSTGRTQPSLASQPCSLGPQLGTR